MREWDEKWNAANIEKYSVSFAAASRIFDVRVVSFQDDRFDHREKREICTGQIEGVLLLTVIHPGRGGKPASSRPAAPMAQKGDAMKKRYNKELSIAELAAVKDEDIDYGDIPQLDDEFWKNARVADPDRTMPVTLRVKKSVLEVYKAQGKGYQTRMNAVLESYARSLRK